MYIANSGKVNHLLVFSQLCATDKPIVSQALQNNTAR